MLCQHGQGDTPFSYTGLLKKRSTALKKGSNSFLLPRGYFFGTHFCQSVKYNFAFCNAVHVFWISVCCFNLLGVKVEPEFKPELQQMTDASLGSCINVKTDSDVGMWAYKVRAKVTPSSQIFNITLRMAEIVPDCGEEQVRYIHIKVTL